MIKALFINIILLRFFQVSKQVFWFVSIKIVMLFNLINEMYKFSINNVVGKPIFNKGLFSIFKFIKEDSSRGSD